MDDADDWEIAKWNFNTRLVIPGIGLNPRFDRTGGDVAIMMKLKIDQDSDEKCIIGMNHMRPHSPYERPTKITKLDALKGLSVNIYYDLSVGIGDLSSLEELSLGRNVRGETLVDILQFTPPRERPLPNLKTLKIEGEKMEFLPEKIGLLGPSLTHLELLDLGPLISAAFQRTGQTTMLNVFPKSMSKLVNLKFVRMTIPNPCDLFVSVDTTALFPHWTALEQIEIDSEFLHSNEDDMKTEHHLPSLREARVNFLPPFTLESHGHRVETIASNLRQLATWRGLQKLVLRQKSFNGCDFGFGLQGHERIGYLLPLSVLSPLANLSELYMNCSEAEPKMTVCFQDLSRITRLEKVTLSAVEFVAPAIQDAGEDNGVVPPKLTQLKLHLCTNFFTDKSRSLETLSTRVDLSCLQVFHVTYARLELGDVEFESLCTRVLKRCPNLREVSLCKGNIHNLKERVASYLATDSLRVLDLNGHPALSLPNGTPAEKDANIKALSYWAARCPYLGYIGHFNELFLGRVGEAFDRLDDYNLTVHQLAVNRARSRILAGHHIVPRGLWALILPKAQRAYDDYPGYVIARNRKEEPDAIFHLLRERGARDIF